MPPNGRTSPPWWHLSFPPSLAIRPALLGVVALFRARGLAKATRPLTCTHFNPCHSPVFPLHLRLPALPADRVWDFFLQIAPNRVEKVPGGLFYYPLFPKQGHKSPHGRSQEVTRLSDSPVQIHQFDNNPASVCNAIPNYFRLTFPCLLFYGIFLFLISTKYFQTTKSPQALIFAGFS